MKNTTIPTRKEHADLIQKVVKSAVESQDATVEAGLAEQLARQIDALFAALSAPAVSGVAQETVEGAVNKLLPDGLAWRRRALDAEAKLAAVSGVAVTEETQRALDTIGRAIHFFHVYRDQHGNLEELTRIATVEWSSHAPELLRQALQTLRAAVSPSESAPSATEVTPVAHAGGASHTWCNLSGCPLCHPAPSESAGEREAGTSACPLCGVTYPHRHRIVEVDNCSTCHHDKHWHDGGQCSFEHRVEGNVVSGCGCAVFIARKEYWPIPISSPAAPPAAPASGGIVAPEAWGVEQDGKIVEAMIRAEERERTMRDVLAALCSPGLCKCCDAFRDGAALSVSGGGE